MTTIEWTHPPGFKGESWNPVTGCTKVSHGCKNCYAETVFPRAYGKARVPDVLDRDWPDFMEHKGDIVGLRPRKFTDVQMHPDRLHKPLHARNPRCYFVNSMSDLFHEDVPDEFIDRVFATMALCPQHRFIVLTKRPRRMLEWYSEQWKPAPAREVMGLHIPAETTGENRLSQVERAAEQLVDGLGLSNPGNAELWTGDGKCKAMQWAWPLPNVWLGVSVEDQETADERIPLLLQTPAAVRLVSYEPALGPVTFFSMDGPVDIYPGFKSPLDWIIVGGESGPRARPFDVAWARDTVRQCREAGVACFVKQIGARPVHTGRWLSEPVAYTSADKDGCAHFSFVPLSDRKGGDPSEWPEDLRVREWPAT